MVTVLALAGGHGYPPAAPFNSDLYFTAATVIPVLYLALTLQDKAWLTIVLRVKRRQVEANRASLRGERISWSQRRDAWLFGVMNQANGWVILGGAIGEISAFVALANRHANTFEEYMVMVSTIGLVAVVGGLEVFRYL